MAVTIFVLLLCATSASASETRLDAGNPEVAALQVGLRAHGLYGGSVDGVMGMGTVSAIKRLQRRAGIPTDGVAGARTRGALGRYGTKAPLGRRVLMRGTHGWDVAALQFALAWHGFPSGAFDGRFGAATERALLEFQQWAALPADGRAGTEVVSALRAPLASCPITLTPPVAGPYTELFGPRGARFHSGNDYPGPIGTPVTAAASGVVTFAGWSAGGWGKLIVIAHTQGTRTMYAHLSRVGVRVGQRVATGQRIGRIGASGHATGPHLHFEVRLRGAAVNPLTGLT